MRSQIVVFAVLLYAVAGNAWGDVQYTVTDLGTLPDFPFTYATGINDNGQVVGYGFGNGTFLTHAFLFSNGTLTDLGVGLPSSKAYGINNNGQIVGGNGGAFLYSGSGPMQDLGKLPGAPPFAEYGASGINDSGQVVGTALFYWPDGSTANQAFLYSASGGMQSLAHISL